MNDTVLLTLILLLAPVLTSSSGRPRTVKTPKMDLINTECSFEYNICNKTRLDASQEGSVKKILDLYPDLHSFFTNEIVYEALVKPTHQIRIEPQSSDGREPLSYQNLCWAEEVTFVPTAVLTTNHKRKPIVNEDKYKQVVKGIICRKSYFKNYCTSLSGFGTYPHAKCEQRWSTVTLLGLDQDTKKPEHVRVKIPSDCVCTVKHTDY